MGVIAFKTLIKISGEKVKNDLLKFADDKATRYN